MGNNDIIVLKFGGSSLADAAQMKKVKAIIEMDDRRRYVVPSAPGKRDSSDTKVTDLLYAVKKQALDGENTEHTFGVIRQRFIEMRDELELDFDIEKHLDIVERDLINGASLDYTASRGEYLNGLILAAFLGYEFVDAADVIFFDAKGQLDLGKQNP